MEAILILSFFLGVFYLLRGLKYFIKSIFRFVKPIFIMMVFGTDRALQSEVEHTENYKKFKDELNDML